MQVEGRCHEPKSRICIQNVNFSQRPGLGNLENGNGWLAGANVHSHLCEFFVLPAVCLAFQVGCRRHCWRGLNIMYMSKQAEAKCRQIVVFE